MLSYSCVPGIISLMTFTKYPLFCREAEDKLEQSQKMVIEKQQSLQKSQEECIKLKVDLLEQSKQGKRYVFLKQIIVFIEEKKNILPI